MCSSYRNKKVKMPINVGFTRYGEVICNEKYHCEYGKSSVSPCSLQYIIPLLMICLCFSVTEGEFSLWTGNEQLPQDRSHHSRFQYVRVIVSYILRWSAALKQALCYKPWLPASCRGGLGSPLVQSQALQHPLGWGPAVC